MANPYFNATYYLANNPDVFAAGINTAEGAWAHYEQYGAAEALNGVASRSPAPWFDIVYYRAENPDLNTAGLTAGQLFSHFTEYGLAEGRSPSAAAEAVNAESLAAYAAANEDLREAFGIEEGEEPTEAQLILLAKHFYQFGYNEDREGLPVEFNDNPGSTFTLTTGVDDLTGTTGDDLFQAIFDGEDEETNTINTFDKVNGNTGTDTLLIVGEGGGELPSNVTISNIEIVNVETENAITNLNSSYFGGVKELWQVGDAGAVTVGAGVVAGFRNTLVEGTDTISTAAAAVAVALDNVTTGSTLVFDGDDLASVTVSGTVAANGDNAGELTLSAADDVEITSVTLSLTSSVDITFEDGDFDAVTSVDASGSTGALGSAGSAVNLGDLTSLESYVGSAGADTIDAAFTAEADLAIDVGAGNDRITLDAGNADGGSVVITLGAGKDLLTVVDFANVSFDGETSDDDLLAEIISVTDFSASDDVLRIAAEAELYELDNSEQGELETILEEDGLVGAVVYLAGLGAADAADVFTFQFDGNTYVFMDDGEDGVDGGGLIELTGFTGTLAANNFQIVDPF